MKDSATKVETTIAELVSAFPAAFTLDPKLVRQLKLGMKDDLCAQSTISRGRISAALRSYCHTIAYLTASTEGAARIDLSGAPAGTVSATEAHHAMEVLAALSTVATKRAGKIASAPGNVQTSNRPATEKPSLGATTAAPKGSEPGKCASATGQVTPGQKRLSLSDLKRAAVAKKATR